MKIQVYIHPRLRIHPSPLVIVLISLMGIGFLAAVVRFANGIGAISNLSNTFPWGFWISFDIFTGIAISSGAFILAALIYIFDIKKFRPLLMPSVLTALLGYIMEVLALMVDLGHPERIWHMLIYQNYTSNMLVVGLCVMIYTGILAVEFAPTVFDGLKWQKYASFARRLIVPTVILGVVISTIHQGSLGSLLLIQSAKLHPIWWTPLLPVMFFLSSLPIGLAMVIVESSLSSRYFRRGLEIQLLDKLAGAIPVLLGIYLLVKFAQLAIAGSLSYLFTSGLMSILFWMEIIIGSLIPLILFSFKRIRKSPKGLLTVAIILLTGMILNRFNVSWFGIHRLTNVSYIPSLPEISISLAIFSFGILGFGLAAKYLPLFEKEEERLQSPH